MQKQGLLNFIWNTIGVSINAFASLLYLIMITRINGVDTAGVFSYCFAFSIILYTAANIGNRVYEVSDTKGFGDSTYFTLKYFTCAAGFIACLVFFVISKDLQRTILLLIFMVVRSYEAFSDTLYAVWQKRDRLDYVGISYVIKNISAFLLFGAVDYLTKNIYFATFAMLAATVLTYYFYDKTILNKYQKLKFIKDFKQVLNLFKSIIYFLVFTLLTIVIPNIPRIVVDMKYTNSELGYFGILMMIPTVMILLGQLIVQPFIITLTDFADNRKYKKLFNKTLVLCLYVTVASVLCCVAAWFLGPFVLQLLYGIPFDDYKISLIVLVLAGMFNAYTVIISTSLTIFRKTFFQLVIYVLVVILETVVMFVCLGKTDFTFSFWLYMYVMIAQSVVFLGYFIIVYIRKLKGKA